jgi:hypothetical protein
MDTAEFAAARARRLQEADKEIGPFVSSALANYGQAGAWDDVIVGASVLWLETYDAQHGREDEPTEELAEFQKLMRESLAKTAQPANPPTEGEVDRVTRWVGTITVNDATWRALGSGRTRTMRWVAMDDSATREMHRVADGQVRSVDGTFDVGGYRLHYPGEPVGPTEVWINCRCLIAPGDIRRSMRIVSTSMAVELPEDETAEVDESIIEEEPLVDDDVDEVPWHAVLAPEGVPTGDGRMFAAGSLSTRDLPLPITYQYETAEGHMKAVVVARMDEAWLDEPTGQYRARGVFWMNEPMAHKAIDGIAQGFLRGLSVDVDDVEIEQQELPEEASPDDIMELMMGNDVTVFSKARIAGAAIVHIPAFHEAYIALGPDFDDELAPEEAAALAACGCATIEYDEDEDEEIGVVRGYDLAEGGIVEVVDGVQLVGETGPEYVIPLAAAARVGEFAPGTKDGPGWITHPRATSRIRRYWVSGKGAAKIKWGAPGDFNRCRAQLAKYVRNPDWLAGLCANMHKEALGFWPGEHHSADALVAGANVERAPLFVLIEDEFEPQAIVAGAGSDWPDHFPSSAFANPGLTEETPITFTADGRVFGHLATWTACHVGMDGFCQNPPPSRDDYAHFRKGVLDTDEGPIRIGTLTYGIGHASLGASREAAVRHYDKPNAVRAYVATGEDAIGIWFAGVLKPGLTKKQIGEFKALGAVSGDWRYVGRELELIGVTAVNVPGFQIARKTALVAAAGGHQTALIPPPVVAHPNAKPIGAFSAEEAAAIARAAAREVIEEQKSRERLSAVRAVAAQVRADRLAAVREHASKGA